MLILTNVTNSQRSSLSDKNIKEDGFDQLDLGNNSQSEPRQMPSNILVKDELQDMEEEKKDAKAVSRRSLSSSLSINKDD